MTQTEQTEKPITETTSTPTPTLNEQQRRLIHRLTEVGINTNRFLRVDENKKAIDTDFQNNLFSPKDLTTFPRWGIIGSPTLVLIDFDKQETYNILSKRLPDTLEVTSPRRGLPHRYYKVIGGQVENKQFHIPRDVDERGLKNASGEIRSNNHYLVAPGTTIRYHDLTSGEWKTGEYTITNDIPIATLTYIEFMAAVEPYLLNRSGEKRLTDEMLTDGISAGVRHDTIFRYACRLMGDNPEGGYPATITLDILRRYNRDLVKPSVEDDYIVRVIKQACEYAAKESGAPVEQIAQLGFKEIHKQQSGQDQGVLEQLQQIEQEIKQQVTLEKVKDVYKKWLTYDEASEEGLEVVLACGLDRFIPGDPAWLLVIAPPGGKKTEQVRALSNKEMFYTLDSLTAHTLISGKVDKNEDGEFVPVKGILPVLNGKVLVLKDFTTILQKNSDERAEIFSQFRSLYDGYLEFAYGNLNEKIRLESEIGLIAAVTPAVDQYTRLYGILGERFLKLRLTQDPKSSTKRALQNNGLEPQMRKEIEDISTQYYKAIIKNPIQPPKLTDQQNDQITDIACAVAILRTPVSFKIYSYEVYDATEPIIESPTRLAKQLAKVVQALCVIRRKNTVTPYELLTIRRVAQDTCYPNRIKIIHTLKDKENHTTREIAEKTRIPLSTCWRDLKELEYLNVVNYNKKEETNGYKYQHKPEADGWILTDETVLNALSPSKDEFILESIKDSTPTEKEAQNSLFQSHPPHTCCSVNNNKGEKAKGCNGGGYVAETPQKKPRWFVKEIPPGAKCEGCGKYVVTKEIITPQHELMKRCDSCLKKLQETFNGAEFFPAYPDLEGREA